MPSPTVRLINRAGFIVYQETLNLEQIAVFEYFVDISRFSPNGVFRIKSETIQRELRLGRRKTESILKWLEEIGLLVPRPVKKNEVKTFFFDFQKLVQSPNLIFAQGIPDSPEYRFIVGRSKSDKRIQIFKTHGKRKDS